MVAAPNPITPLRPYFRPGKPPGVLFPYVCIVLAAALLASEAGAQPVDRGLSEDSRISLLTVLPGDEIYSMYGHSAFRVVDPMEGIDETFNYGTFHFGNPVTFALKFAYGRLDYMLSEAPFDWMIYAYRDIEQRPVIEQVLNLSLDQRNAVYRFLQINALPENREYRYDFLFDNCSTRLRAVLEKTLGDQIAFSGAHLPEASFRRLIDPYQQRHPFIDAGIDLLLGAPVDRTASPRETTFLPDYLMASFEAASVEIGGRKTPLVARCDTLVRIAGYDRTPRRAHLPAVVFWSVFIGYAIWTLSGFHSGGYGRAWPDVLLFAVVGVAGLLILFLWFISEHTVTAGNWNLAWAWPTHFLVAFLPALGRRPGWLRLYMAAAAVGCILFLLFWTVIPQDIPASFIPLLLTITLRAGWYAFHPRLRRGRLRPAGSLPVKPIPS